MNQKRSRRTAYIIMTVMAFVFVLPLFWVIFASFNPDAGVGLKLPSTWVMENYQAVLQRSIRLSPGVPVQGQDPLRQMKTSIIVFTTLVCRAAMEGGLSPEGEQEHAVFRDRAAAVDQRRAPRGLRLRAGELSALAL